MLATSTQGKALIATLRAMKVGQSMMLPPPIPALPNESQAILAEVEGDRYWRLELFWNGIAFGEVVAEISEDKLILEQL